MSSRTIASGSDFACFVRTGEPAAYVYKPVASQTNCTLQRGPNYRETNAKTLGGVKNFFKGISDWNASVDMDIPDNINDANANEISYEELQDMEEAGTKPTLVFCWITALAAQVDVIAPDATKRMYVGVGLISAPMNAPSGENATSGIAIQGCLRLDIVDPA